MAENKTIFGRITCPYCHTAEGMRITQDKNGNPFGHADICCQGQLRIGGNPARVAKFFNQHPKIAAAMRGDIETELTPTKAADNQKPTPTPSEKPAAKSSDFTLFN